MKDWLRLAWIGFMILINFVQMAVAIFLVFKMWSAPTLVDAAIEWGASAGLWANARQGFGDCKQQLDEFEFED